MEFGIDRTVEDQKDLVLIGSQDSASAQALGGAVLIAAELAYNVAEAGIG